MSQKPKNFTEALDELGNYSSERAQDLKGRLQEELRNLEARIEELKPQLDEVKAKVRDEAAKAKGKVEEQVKENPWATVGIVGLIFFILGFLFATKGSRHRD